MFWIWFYGMFPAMMLFTTLRVYSDADDEVRSIAVAVLGALLETAIWPLAIIPLAMAPLAICPLRTAPAAK